MAVNTVLPEYQDTTVVCRGLSEKILESAEGEDLAEGSEGNKEVSVLLKSDEIEHDGELPDSGFLNIVLHTTHDTGRRIRLSIRNHPRPLPPPPGSGGYCSVPHPRVTARAASGVRAIMPSTMVSPQGASP